MVAVPVAAAQKSGTSTRTSEGMASWYGPRFHGRQTESGERFNMNEFTAAHPSLPFGTQLRVTHEATGKSVIVLINDRGPHAGIGQAACHGRRRTLSDSLPRVGRLKNELVSGT